MQTHLKVTECPNIEFTDIIKCDNMYILRGNCGNLYRNVNDSYESSKIQIEPPVSFVWKDWTVGFGTYNTKKSLIFISEDLTIWECDLEKEAVEQRQALQTLTHLGSGQFSQNIQPCIYSERCFLLYIMQNPMMLICLMVQSNYMWTKQKQAQYFLFACLKAKLTLLRIILITGMDDCVDLSVYV
eukprot:Platyproteum_vivax@DN6939_c0_g1_i3.p1